MRPYAANLRITIHPPIGYPADPPILVVIDLHGPGQGGRYRPPDPPAITLSPPRAQAAADVLADVVLGVQSAYAAARRCV